MVKRDDQFLPKRLKALNQLERRGAAAIRKPSSLDLAEKAAINRLPGSEPAFRFIANRLPKRSKKQSKRSISPLLVIILILFALPIFLFQSLFSPLTQLSARLFDKFNYQEVSINNGVARIVKNMVDDQPSRYRELNDQRQISTTFKDALKRQDIIIDQDNHQSLANFDTVKSSLEATNQTADQLTKDKQAPINRSLPKLGTLDEQVVQNNYLCTKP